MNVCVQTLDFSLEERLCLAELSLALDNELLVSGNGLHQAALVSYKNEINYLQWVSFTYHIYLYYQKNITAI